MTFLLVTNIAGDAMNYWLASLIYPCRIRIWFRKITYPLRDNTYLVPISITDVLFEINPAEWNLSTDLDAGCELGEVVWPVQCKVLGGERSHFCFRVDVGLGHVPQSVCRCTKQVPWRCQL